MKNLKKRVFTHKSKSKIFITILCIFGLLFSWSCSCKNRVSDPNETPINGGITNKKPDETPPGTFSMSAATDNVTDNFIVKSDSTSGEIKIAFVSANNYAYTSSYEVVDNDTTEANRITTAETTYANNVLTIKDTALAKVRQLDSSGGPAEKTITINFTFKANDASLKNNTQTLSVEVKLTHAQKPADDTTKKNFMETVLQKGGDVQITEGSGPEAKRQVIETTKGTFDTANNTFTAKPTLDKGVKINKTSGSAALKAYTDYYFENQYKPYIASYTFDKAEGGSVSDDYYSLTYKDITFTDKYECDITTITFKFEKGKSDTWGD